MREALIILVKEINSTTVNPLAANALVLLLLLNGWW